MIVYATLNQLRDRLNLPADSDRDARLLGALRQATAQIDRYTARRFAPVIQTRRYRWQAAGCLRLDIDLLALLSLTNGDGRSIDPADVTLAPSGDGPYSALLVDPQTVAFVNGYPLDQAIAVRGVWGWHDAWAAAWRSSGDTLQATSDADDALLSVADAAGADGLGLTPRFQVGQLIRLGRNTPMWSGSTRTRTRSAWCAACAARPPRRTPWGRPSKSTRRRRMCRRSACAGRRGSTSRPTPRSGPGRTGSTRPTCPPTCTASPRRCAIYAWRKRRILNSQFLILN